MSRRRRNRAGRHRPSTPHLRPVESQSEPTSRLRRALEVDHWAARSLADQAARFGGVDAFETLDAAAVPPDEPFDWTAVAPTDHQVVAAVLAALDDFSASPSMRRRGEYVTILRRLLAEAARAPEATIRRRTSPERIAAALTWIAFAGNGELSGRRGQFSASTLWYLFDVGDCAQLARSIAAHLGMLEEQPAAPPRHRWLVRLRDPRLFRGYVRVWAIEDCDEFVDAIEREVAARAEQAVLQITPEGIGLQAREAEFAMCVPGKGLNGTPVVAIALGTDPFEPDEAFFLSHEHGCRLLDSLQRVLGRHERRTS